MTDQSKQLVHDFWDAASCGEALYLTGEGAESYRKQAAQRYELEPYIRAFANFDAAANREVLEIGVGLGADHQAFAEAGAVLSGIDLTERAISHTVQRFKTFGLKSSLQTADAENLPFADASFDIVYSWGVLHHSPNTGRAIAEVYRVLRPGGTARIMIYQKHSIVGWILWARYALLKGRPGMSLTAVYARYLESPGTKAYTIAEAKAFFRNYASVKAWSVLTHGDLLSSNAGQRHTGALLSFARKVWPRGLIKTFLPNRGLFMLIEATK
jgi:ubiquinone/menaquinone biosynthesis C-methylase UbiE